MVEWKQFRGGCSMLQMSKSSIAVRRVFTKLISPAHPTLNFLHPTLESFTWNNLIRTQPNPLSLFVRMRSQGVTPDFHTFPFLLHSLSSHPHLFSGQQLHAQTILFGLIADPFVQTSLINMYSKCGVICLARKMFDEIPDPDLPSWNAIIDGYVKSGLVEIARKLFDEMPVRNVVSWSCMINGLVVCGEHRKGIELFREMQISGGGVVRPNGFTMSAVLTACGRLGALEHGEWAHAYIDKCGIEVDAVLGTALIDMYAKCGSIEKAGWVFENLGSEKDVTAWSAMISGLAMHGLGKECVDLFLEMMQHGVKPNAVTFLGLLCGCVHGGLVNEGKQYFRRMSEEFGITPGIGHYGCLVDLFAKAGLIIDALKVVESMPIEPDVLIWGALLSGARTYGDKETSEIALKKLIEIDPCNSSSYVLLSNVYAKMGMWNDVRRIRDLMEVNGAKKVPGCSLVELGGVLHEFFVGDDSHPESLQIYMMLNEIMTKLKKEGYMVNTKEVLLDLDEEGKETALLHHSEKLAVAYCFLKTSPGTPIRVVKNLRICSDCHVAIKMISKVYNREIVVRDCNRFHHIKDGICSCRDYW